jgi:formylglycine-generating enzyme required for sulfatase activity
MLRRAGVFVGLPFACCVSLAGCGQAQPEPSRLPEGTSPGECADRVDNDGDGASDCADDGCLADDACAMLRDGDGDGVAAEDDCDDADATLGAAASDVDCDGARAVDDCDDGDVRLGSRVEDADCDGARTVDDCDDGDARLGSHIEDADCDGALWRDDCDDGDALVGLRLDDVDCDGARAVDDCDDGDVRFGLRVEDADCDGARTVDDCDDGDVRLGLRVEDADCDGARTVDDCDDGDARLGSHVEDADCDGALWRDDCDDSDGRLGLRIEDVDCDGAWTVDDCDDGDVRLGLRVEDADCDGARTVDDCDDGDVRLGSHLDDADCDGSLWRDDCDDDDAGVWPGAPEVCDLSDSDCDADLRDGFPDVDADGLPDCVDPAPHPTLGTLRYIPAGTFTMGCVLGRDDVSGGCQASELPAHSVTLTSAFWMMEAEVTQAMWMALGLPNYAESQGDGLPYETASWWDAVEAANAASLQDGLSACYALSGCQGAVGAGRYCASVTFDAACAGWRLPTEAEWEWAARGGEDAPYAGSSDPDAVGWYAGNSLLQTHEGCGKQRNGFGLCDMAGNVWEWVGDWGGAFGRAAAVDPVGPVSGTERMLRGGSFEGDASWVRTARRIGIDPVLSYRDVGVRLVRTAD